MAGTGKNFVEDYLTPFVAATNGNQKAVLELIRIKRTNRLQYRLFCIEKFSKYCKYLNILYRNKTYTKEFCFRNKTLFLLRNLVLKFMNTV